MRPILFILVTGVAFVYDLGLSADYAVGDAAPDLLFAVVAWVALEGGVRRAVLYGVLVGVLADAASLEPWGVHALGYGTAGGLLAFSAALAARGSIARVAISALGAGLAVLIRLGIVFDAKAELSLSVELSSILYTTVVATLAAALLDPLRRRILTPRYRRLE